MFNVARTFRIVFYCFILGGCSSASVAPSAPGFALRSQSSLASRVPAFGKYASLYTFTGASDGANPEAGLVNVGGALYGTTANGGSSGGGTVFTVTTSGAERTLHNFGNGTDGARPTAGLTVMHGLLYGTTLLGGSSNPGNGTVFRISTSGTEHVVYRFKGGSGDGAKPAAGLVTYNGALYGTTESGGAAGVGTVFRVTASGAESLLHSFGTGTDGSNPQAGMIVVNGLLYGTTRAGGFYNNGTVFTVDASGTESVLYSFTGGLDGVSPAAPITEVNGVLYGTTQAGGNGGCSLGCGTVFTLTTAGVESVLYRFQSQGDGASPQAGLLYTNGALYGTTMSGGQYSVFGTVFSVTTSGAQNVLYSFNNIPDGDLPMAGLIRVGSALYGTTYGGGSAGYGTVFAVSP